MGGLLLGLLGVGIATYPLLQNSYATVSGLLIFAVWYDFRFGGHGVLRQYPVAVTESGHQRLAGFFIGGVLLLPFTLLSGGFSESQYDGRFWASVFWLILPVSVAALQLWFYLIRQDPVRASLWLFLCPIFGFSYSYVLMGEPITEYTVVGTFFVIGGLWLGRKK